MNPLNYATLEASKRLADAGIVLETEVWWMLGFDEKYSLVHCATEVMREVVKQRPGSIPAPSMAEVWRELPDTTQIILIKRGVFHVVHYSSSAIYTRKNPTDALIDLLIWVRKEKAMNTNLKKYVELCSIPEVQKKIREGMGDRQLGDRVIDPMFGEGIISSYSTEQSFGVTFSDGFQCGYSSSPKEWAGDGLIRLPQVHDLNNEKRGLWGMVDWSKFKPSINDSGNIAMWLIDEDGKLFPQAQWNHTPELALLRACMAQWGIGEV